MGLFVHFLIYYSICAMQSCSTKWYRGIKERYFYIFIIAVSVLCVGEFVCGVCGVY